MRKLWIYVPLSAMLFFGVSCQSDRSKEQASIDEQTEERAENSEEIAEDANEDKFSDRDVKNDAEFVADQVAANLGEIKLAELAVQKSSLDDIKKVAKMLEDEHAKKLAELKKFADEKSITVPVEANKESLETMQDLRDETDVKDFNKEWCKEMVDKHEETIKDFEKKMEKTDDADLKAWIGQTLPSLRSHLDQLKACHEKVKDA